MACVPEEAVNRMTRLIGDADKAECKVNKLRSITDKMDEKELEAEAEIFKAMADPCRLKILMLLREGELCVCEIMIGCRQAPIHHFSSPLHSQGCRANQRAQGRKMVQIPAVRRCCNRDAQSGEADERS